MTEPLTPEQLRAIAHLSKYDIFPQGSAESAVQLLLREVERLKQELSATHQVIDALNIASANASDRGRFARWHRALLGRGIYWPPSQLETAFVSLAHSPQDITTTLEAAEAALRDASQ